MSKPFAIRLHSVMCNSPFGCDSPCGFINNPTESDWETNPFNQIYSELDENAQRVIAEASITENHLLKYVESFVNHRMTDIPDDVLDIMKRCEFL